MYKRIKWYNGLTLTPSLLTEQEDLTQMYCLQLLTGITDHYYGIQSIMINPSALTQGVLQITNLHVIYPTGVISTSLASKTLDINALYTGSELPIYLSYSPCVSTYITYETQAQASPSSILLGRVTHRNGFHFTASGCYLRMRQNSSFIATIQSTLEQLSSTLLILNEQVLTNTGEAYTKSLLEQEKLIQLATDLNLIQNSLSHPFDAYCRLIRYIPWGTYTYDHTDSIGCLSNMLKAITSQYFTLTPTTKVRVTEDGYIIPFHGQSIQLVLTSNNLPDAFTWAQDAHIGSLQYTDLLQEQRYRGLNRTVTLKPTHLVVEILRNNKYMDDTNEIILPKSELIINVYLNH